METNTLAAQRQVLIIEIVAAFIMAALLWAGIFNLVPVFQAVSTLNERLLFALKLVAVAVTFCLLTGIEAVAHERFQSPGIDPLTGYSTRRMSINLQYLQNTLEQLALFIAGLFGLAIYATDARVMLAVTATWILSRFAFWIGYHAGGLHRAVGGPGMMQSLLILLYICASFGFEVAGLPGAVALIVAYLCIEAFLFRATRMARSSR